MTVVDFATERPYEAVIGPGALGRLDGLLGQAARIGILHAPPLAATTARIAGLVRRTGAEPVLVELPSGESAKTPRVLAECWSALAAAGFTRSDLIVGLGGGATTDLAGFIAATWMRGIRWVSVPTTVLAMVDAGIGGKTGADLPEGKNLIGAFWEPVGVLEDTRLLATLPRSELRAGLGEVIKHGFIADERTLRLIEASPAGALDPSGPLLPELIARSVQVKAEVVGADLRESTSVGDRVGRERLNYGHTMGHAIEAGEHYTRRHGECVGLGMIFAAELAHRLIGLAAEHVDRHRRMLELVGLPTHYRGIDWEQARALMARDKKTRGATLRFVGLRAPGQVTMIVDPPESALREAWEALTG